MSNVYETNYGVSFNGHHSYSYYHLLPTSAPTIAPPVVKTFYVESIKEFYWTNVEEED